MFAQHGCCVAILDLDADAADQAAADLPGAGHVGRACDVTNKESCEAIAADLVSAFGQIDILVNIAGITQPLKFMEIEPQNYDDVLDVNLRGTLYMSQGGQYCEHVVRFRATGWRHFRWATLFSGQSGYLGVDQSDGARSGARWHPRERDLPGVHRD